MEEDRRRLGRLQRRHRVVEAAMDLFERHGYDATNVEDIADAAGVSVRSFYRYFDSKDGVVAALGTDVIEELLARTTGHPSIVALAREFALVADERLDDGRTGALFRLVREEPGLRQHAALWRERWSNELAAGLAARDGRDQPSISDVVVSRTALAMAAVGLDRWLEAGARGPTAGHVDDALRTLRERL